MGYRPSLAAQCGLAAVVLSSTMFARASTATPVAATASKGGGISWRNKGVRRAVAALVCVLAVGLVRVWSVGFASSSTQAADLRQCGYSPCRSLVLATISSSEQVRRHSFVRPLTLRRKSRR